ncbi:hypothetical protein D1Y84_09365 [Acidipila sp. EB88]|nr:hypothetical protein D1Y84_09365 [Acidipila sp. EB88]
MEGSITEPLTEEMWFGLVLDLDLHVPVHELEWALARFLPHALPMSRHVFRCRAKREQDQVHGVKTARSAFRYMVNLLGFWGVSFPVDGC